MNVVMTIAGSDSGGGAGIQADLKTFQELKVFGTSVITALTAQNTTGVFGVLPTPAEFVRQQLQVLLNDFDIKAIKTGMLFSAEIIEVVTDELLNKNIPLIIDPVMIAKGGESLLQKQAVQALQQKLLPLATVLTPNIPEAEVLTGITIKNNADISRVAAKILAYGASAVVIKGGHLSHEAKATDYIFTANGDSFALSVERINTPNTHGTGCTFSAALTAFIGQGYQLAEAIIEAKKFIHLAIVHDLKLGHGHGPTNHFAYQQQQKQCDVEIYAI